MTICGGSCVTHFIFTLVLVTWSTKILSKNYCIFRIILWKNYNNMYSNKIVTFFWNTMFLVLIVYSTGAWIAQIRLSTSCRTDVQARKTIGNLFITQRKYEVWLQNGLRNHTASFYQAQHKCWQLCSYYGFVC